MNNQIRQVYGVVIVLFALLVGFTSYWSVLDAKGLKDNPDNRRTLIEEQTIPRGLIFARDGRPDREQRAPSGAATTASSCATTRRAGCSRTRSATRSSRTAGAGSSVAQRRPGRQAKRVRVDLRRAGGPRPRGRRRRHQPRRGRHQRRRRRARRAQGRGGRDRAADRQGACDGVDPGVRPEPDPERLPRARHRPEQADAQPRPRRSYIRPARRSRW